MGEGWGGAQRRFGVCLPASLWLSVSVCPPRSTQGSSVCYCVSFLPICSSPSPSVSLSVSSPLSRLGGPGSSGVLRGGAPGRCARVPAARGGRGQHGVHVTGCRGPRGAPVGEGRALGWRGPQRRCGTPAAPPRPAGRVAALLVTSRAVATSGQLRKRRPRLQSRRRAIYNTVWTPRPAVRAASALPAGLFLRPGAGDGRRWLHPCPRPRSSSLPLPSGCQDYWGGGFDSRVEKARPAGYPGSHEGLCRAGHTLAPPTPGRCRSSCSVNGAPVHRVLRPGEAALELSAVLNS